MEMRTKYIKLIVPIYGTEVFVTSEAEECTRLAKKHCGIDMGCYDFHANGMVVHSNDTQIIWLPAQAGLRTIVHECTHVAMNMCHYKGLLIDASNQEPFTYLMGYLVYEIEHAHKRLNDDN